ncbi:UDP-glycosyltransferase 91D1-like [Cynara cardunculus var. scolymus]|uniref:UDP-glycosyltransferase 91D1-like n=1 Tax=Cynara cardunculus var. scolymus TaxID=59895 RepID=UPI000D626959|nr:UDP-glycosyltransferase 91D1-like [Cynara cardunculus var. scolymus]
MATTDSNGNSKQLHVVMFPWLAFGHIIPFLELSKFIAEKGHRVSFLSTTRNIQRLPPSHHLSQLITLVPLTLPPAHHLPQNAEATMDVRTHDIPHLKKAFDGLQHQLTTFLEVESPDWIIYDFAPYWLPSIAAGLGISRAFFSIINPWFLAFLGRSPEELINGSDDRKTVEDFMAPPKWVPFPTKICYQKHEANWILDGSSSLNASGVSDTYRSGMIFQASDCMFIRYCYEFEPQWLTLFEDLHHLPVIPVGLMPPATATNVGDEKDDAWLTIKNWLDGQQKGQVVYVALGSEVMLTKTELGELALGLELSGLPFFWALRKPAGSTESETVELPEGFIERTRDRGMVWKKWVPQLEILSHVSVGGFLTHCGWGSIVEGLALGHPLIMLPFLVDQGLNARALVEKQVGMEVERNEEDGSFSKESVAKSVRLVVVEDKGKMYKEKSMELSRIFGNTKLQKKYTDDFVEYLEKHRSSSVPHQVVGTME